MGQIAFLKWSDIFRDFTIMSIYSTYIEYYDTSINSKVKTINSPKSKASKGTVPIPDYLQKKLKEYKERKRFIDNQFNRIFKEDSFIFTNSDGELRNTAYYAYVMKFVFNYLLKKYNIQLEHFTAHYFRHTFVSRAIRNSISLETLKELLGHSNYEMISSIYAHSS